jgi:hypothetical protein
MTIETVLREVSNRTYRWESQDGKVVGTVLRGYNRGQSVNPITALAYRKTGTTYRNTKKDTLKAGTALGLNSSFVEQVYDAVSGLGSHRGNTQVLRGRIRNYLNV